MSLVRSADMSTASYRNSKLYTVQAGNNGSGLSAPLYGSDKRNLVYMTESFNSPSYDLDFFMDPNPFESSYLGLRTDENAYDLESLISRSPDGVGYDEGKMRLKLRELEHAKGQTH